MLGSCLYWLKGASKPDHLRYSSFHLPTLSHPEQAEPDRSRPDIFLRHKVNEIYGIALLHKHFQIQSTERLVDIRNVSSPWEAGGDTSSVLKKALGVMVEKGLITEAEKEKAEEEQKKSIALPFTSETPSKRALKD
ncbi:hypothetical protein N0V84_011894 [Fusarium piperis]|uniref:Uncharacterized protein n=1 Tax=Fusarium piperis TaxID=1435070 RepID=A0A9W8W353_9HYPO|nr:hypothetical protein N0V84_011894 [Fusarium piperis]